MSTLRPHKCEHCGVECFIAVRANGRSILLEPRPELWLIDPTGFANPLDHYPLKAVDLGGDFSAERLYVEHHHKPR